MRARAKHLPSNMSLSFVKSAVLSSTDGVSHNEETTINNTETQSLRASGGGGAHKPLFEQLRANKDAEQEKDEEFQRSLRGMRPLDEEDCAHLDAVDRVREEKEYAVKSGIEREVALFHAAREDRGLAQTVVDGDDNIKGGGNNNAADVEDVVFRDGKGVISKSEMVSGEPSIAAGAKKNETKRIVPKFTIKKKRKRISHEPGDRDDTTKKCSVDEEKQSNKHESSETTTATGEEGADATQKIREENTEPSPEATANSDESDSDNEVGGGLLGLGCYGSDSD